MADQTKAKSASAEVKGEDVSLLDQILDNVSSSREPEQRAFARDIVSDFAKQVLDGAMVYAKDTESMIKARIAQLDALISPQLNEVMHAPEFQKLEATWRGLKYLVQQTETGTMLKIKIFNVSKKDLLKDLEKAAEFDQSAMFKKVYEEEYGVFGGAPFGLLVGDYEFGNHPQDISLLEKMSNVAAAAHAPFISAADAKMFDLESYGQLGEPRDLAKIFDTVEYAKWKSFRESEDSRYVGLCLPHMLLRLPYGSETVPVEAFNFEEDVDGTDHKKYLWGNAAYAMATRITDGVREERLVHGDPRRGGRRPRRGAADAHLPDRRRRHRAEVPDRNRHHRPPREGARRPGLHPARAPEGARLRRVLLRAVGAEGQDVRQRQGQRERAAVGAAAVHLRGLALRALPEVDDARQDRQLHVTAELRGVPQPLDHAVRAARRRRKPGAEGEVPAARSAHRGRRSPGKPGAYRAIAFLRPHFQLDELDVSLRLVAELPQPSK